MGLARGHRVEGVDEIPLVVEDSVQAVQKTSEALAVLKQFGVDADVAKAKASRKIRAGKGKMRNRRYVARRGPLVIYDQDQGICQAFRNLPGVELCQVDRLNLLQLAPGGHLGRLCVWTESAFKKLDSVFGTSTDKSDSKSGFSIPNHIMANADLARIINSDEIQSVIRAAQPNARRFKLKRNPLRNRSAMRKLNPYHQAIAEAEEAQREASRKRKLGGGGVTDAKRAKNSRSV